MDQQYKQKVTALAFSCTGRVDDDPSLTFILQFPLSTGIASGHRCTAVSIAFGSCSYSSVVKHCGILYGGVIDR